MFNNKEVRETTITEMMGNAIDSEDWELVKKLRDIQKETDQKAFEERMNGFIMGYGLGISCVIMGGVVVKVIISKRRV